MKATVEVFHAQASLKLPSSERGGFFYTGNKKDQLKILAELEPGGEGYKRIAKLEVDVDCVDHALNAAYIRTNHTYRPWTEDESIERFEGSSRSTSVGDVLSVDGTNYVVSAFGFDKLEEQQ